MRNAFALSSSEEEDSDGGGERSCRQRKATVATSKRHRILGRNRNRANVDRLPSNNTATPDRSGSVNVEVQDMGETQAKSDELDYLIEGLSRAPATRRASVLRLVETCSTPRSRYILRLGGGLIRLLNALAIAEEVSNEDEVARLGLSALAFTLLQDRANIKHITTLAIQGLLALVAPLCDSGTKNMSSTSTDNQIGAHEGGIIESSSSSSSSSSNSNSGGKRRHALGGKRKRAAASGNAVELAAAKPAPSSSEAGDAFVESEMCVFAWTTSVDANATNNGLNDSSSCLAIRKQLAINGATQLLPYVSNSVTSAELALKTLQHIAAAESAAVAVTAESIGGSGSGDGRRQGGRTYGRGGSQPSTHLATLDEEEVEGDPVLNGTDAAKSVSGGGKLNTLAGRLCSTHGIAMLGRVVVAEVARFLRPCSNSPATESAVQNWRWSTLDALVLLEYVIAQSPSYQRSLSPVTGDGDESDHFGGAFVKALLDIINTSLHAAESGHNGQSPSLPPPVARVPSPSTCPSTEAMLSAALRVLINLTHHNPPAVAAVVSGEGLEGVLACFLIAETDASSPSASSFSPTSPSSSMEAATHSGNGARNFDLLLEDEVSTCDFEGDQKVPLQQSSSFDRMLLAMNVLTNCVEISTEARSQLSCLPVSDCRGNRSSNEKRPYRGGAKNTTCILHLVAFLNACCASFAAELAKDIVPMDDGIGESESCLSTGSGSEVDWKIEDLVLAGYCSLLLGCLMRDHRANQLIISRGLVEALKMPRRSFLSKGNGGISVLVRVLKAFVAFQSSAGVLTTESVAPVLAVIEELESYDEDLLELSDKVSEDDNGANDDSMEQCSESIARLPSSSSSSSSYSTSPTPPEIASRSSSPKATLPQATSPNETSKNDLGAAITLAPAATTTPPSPRAPPLPSSHCSEDKDVPSGENLTPSKDVLKVQKMDTPSIEASKTGSNKSSPTPAGHESKFLPSRVVKASRFGKSPDDTKVSCGDDSKTVVVTYRPRRQKHQVESVARTMESPMVSKNAIPAPSVYSPAKSTRSASDASGSDSRTEENPLKVSGQKRKSVKPSSLTSWLSSSPDAKESDQAQEDTLPKTPEDDLGIITSRRKTFSGGAHSSPGAMLQSKTYRRTGRSVSSASVGVTPRSRDSASMHTKKHPRSSIRNSPDKKESKRHRSHMNNDDGSNDNKHDGSNDDDDDIELSLFGDERELSLLDLKSPSDEVPRRQPKTDRSENTGTYRRTRRGKNSVAKYGSARKWPR